MKITVYHGMDITLDVYEIIESVVEIISAVEKISFDEAYQRFAESGTYEALQNPDTLMWSESAEFIASEYDREKNRH